jgi:hypothetical protein
MEYVDIGPLLRNCGIVVSQTVVLNVFAIGDLLVALAPFRINCIIVCLAHAPTERFCQVPIQRGPLNPQWFHSVAFIASSAYRLQSASFSAAIAVLL